MQRTPKQVWRHSNELTEYQIWVGYRVATRQLSVHDEDRGRDNSCRKLAGCSGVKETLEHIFWECLSAQACWHQLISHWMNETMEAEQLRQFITKCASGTAPALSTTTAARLRAEHPDMEEEVSRTWQRMWRIMSSVHHNAMDATKPSDLPT